MADYLFCDTKARDIRTIVGASTRDRVPVKRAINYSIEHIDIIDIEKIRVNI